MSRAPALSREHQSCGLFWERQKIHGSASPEKLHPPPTSCSPGRPLGRISSVSRAPGDGKDGQDAAHRSHCAARASKGISSDAAGPCASVLSAGWNLRGVQRRRAKTGLPSPKGACGLKLRRLRLRVSPRPRNPQRLAMGRRWQGQAHRSARHGAYAPCMRCRACCSAWFAGRWPRSATQSGLAVLAPGALPVPNLEHKHVGARLSSPRGQHGMGQPPPGRAHRPPGEPPLASLPLRDKH